MHIFITGNRQVGKTTILNKILNISKVKPFGFITKPFYDENNLLKGFNLQYISDFNTKKLENDIIGYTDDGEKWFSCPEVFDNFANILIEDFEKIQISKDKHIIIMDELGFFENEAFNFQKIILKILTQKAIPVLGVVKNADTHFLNKIKNHLNIELFNVDHNNRNEILDILSNKMIKLTQKTI